MWQALDGFWGQAENVEAVSLRPFRYAEFTDTGMKYEIGTGPRSGNRICAIAKVACPQKSTSCAGANQRKSHAPS